MASDAVDEAPDLKLRRQLQQPPRRNVREEQRAKGEYMLLLEGRSPDFLPTAVPGSHPPANESKEHRAEDVKPEEADGTPSNYERVDGTNSEGE